MSSSRAEFVHLHVHSEYSQLDGLSRIEQLADRARQLQMPAIALTDHGSLYGAIDFYSACKSREIKPIVGLEAYVAPGKMSGRSAADRAYFHLILLAQNLTGYKNLLKLTTRANLDGFFYKPRIDRDLLVEHHEGLIALSGCFSGEPSRAILDGDPAKAQAAAAWYKELFGENYFLELQDHSSDDDRTVNRGLLEISRELGIPVVATNDSHYTLRENALAQDLLLCIQTNSHVEDPKRMRMEPAEFYVKPVEEMAALFEGVPEALRNTLEIAERCQLKLTFDRLNFPALDHIIPPGVTAQEHLARLCWEALPKRYSPVEERHRQRLEYELSVVETTGFPAYILFVWDFVAWARRQGIACGPRGSAAGSIILYLLGVADIDPVEFKLTFERFLNPERVQMPDIDMDFADDSRERVIEYVVERYGRDRVAQIATFGRLQARAAIRDVGRALGYPLAEVDRVAKLIPTIPVGTTIKQALATTKELQQLYETQPHVKRLVDDAQSIEGVVRNTGVHAAGVVVADEPLVEYVPLQRAAKSETVLVSQYGQKPLEKIGLLKMDFLGLANLTMLQRAVQYIEEARGEKIDLSNLPADEPLTYEKLAAGETHSVFQLEGPGMTRYIKELKPNNIRHLAAMISLYRPGPMQHIPTFIARKEGREPVRYPHPSLEDLLEETYGIIVYQDQVLQVVQRVAGYSLGQADILRRAMGKKLAEEMKREKSRFLEGARTQGYDDAVAERLWEYIEPFAGYAFNKSHAACYALVAYQTAYLKANYPVEWMAAVLTTDALDTDKVVSAIGECRRLGIPLLPPDVNRSQVRFTVERIPNGPRELKLGIRYGLAAVKNVGEGAVEKIVAEREQRGRFRSLDDLCARVDLRTVNKRVIENLIKCGALDELGPRERLLAGLDACMASGTARQRAAGLGQGSLFDDPTQTGEGDILATPLPMAPPLTQRQILAFEKESLGLFFSNHPFQEASRWLLSQVTTTSDQFGPDLAGEKVIIAGAVGSVRRIMTRKGETMVVVTLEDLSGTIEVAAFPRTYSQFEGVWVEDHILIVQGRVDVRDDRCQVICERAEIWEAPAGPPPEPAPEPLGSDGASGSLDAVADPQPAAKRNGNGYGGSGTNGNSHSRTGGNGNGRSNGNGNGNGHGGASKPAAVAARRLVLTVHPSGDEATDRELVDKLHSLLDREGSDRYQLLLALPTRTVRLRATGHRTNYSQALEESLRELLGEANVEVQPIRE